MTGASYDPAKRAIDCVVGLVALVVSAPVQLVVALLVRLRLGSPVLFRQQRPGQHERVFELVKFRTMLDADPASGLVTDEQRLTPLGRTLRSLSLDELPSLYNVVRGDMSLVGPRPLLVRYLPRYTAQQRRRHEVRPGLTGLAQVSGRNGLSWDEKFALDVDYVERRSALLDLRIVLRTIGRVLARDGISARGDATMPEFYGEGVR